MRINDLLRRAWKNLNRNKHRTLLTIIATSIGAASIITMIAVTGAVQEKIIGNFIKATNLLELRADKKPDKNGRNNVGTSLIESISAIKGVKTVSVVGTVEFFGEVKFQNTTINPRIVAIDIASLRRLSSESYKREEVSDIKGALISSNFIEKLTDLKARECSIIIRGEGRELEIPIYINGILTEEKPKLAGNIFVDETGNYPPILYMPVERVDEISNPNFFIKHRELVVEVKNISSMDYVTAQLIGLNFDVDSTYKKVKHIKFFFFLLQTALGALGSITLVIASIGTANTMNMAIMERKKEIGIIKAIGTKIMTVRMIFFIEAAYIGMIGGTFGIGLGYIFSMIINSIFRRNVPYEAFQLDKLSLIPLTAAVMVIGLTILLNVIASASAVNSAVRVDTLQALREE
jgi:acetoin utilization transport system permease protein